MQMGSQSEQLMEEKIQLEKELEDFGKQLGELPGVCGTDLFPALEGITQKRDRLEEIDKQLGVHRDAAPSYQVVISVSADQEADMMIGLNKGRPININALITNISNAQLNTPGGMDWYRPQLFHNGML